MTRGEIWWAELGFLRPVLIVQDNSFNESRIRTVIVVSITTNLNLAEAPGNIYLEMGESNLPKNSVINLSQISTMDKTRLKERVGKLSPELLTELDLNLKLVLGIS